jgi:eukaryotic-like serine/threonine-protein kinase
MPPMNQSPAQQWSMLSALYDQADGMEASELPDWLARLEREGNPLLPQLRRMLEARPELEQNDFMGSLPKLTGAGADPGHHWASGALIGHYRLLHPLGEGGMAEVWLAEREDGAFKRRVAIKLPYPRPGRETFAIRFDRERDILATLRHPNIAGLFDAGVTQQGQAWLALEYVDGMPISNWCDSQQLGLRERVTLFRQVLLAVQHAHANLVIHRDLKPANILVTPRGEVRLLDFGIAKLLESETDAMPETELTREAGRTLTPRYASPEQLTGVPLTTACDIYSLGVVFYELVCGERPYELKLDTAAQLEAAILEIEPRAPSRRALTPEQAQARGLSVKALHKALSPELDAMALRCLAKKPAGRYSSVDALLADIDRWLGGEAVLARAPGAWYRFRKFAARNRLAVGLGASAIVSLVAVATVAVVLGLQARQESARAVASRDFMLQLFKRADQEKSRGADITARDLLETGRKDVLTRLADQPGTQAELLEGIVSIQLDMGDNQTADGTYAELVRIYRQLGQPRLAALAQAARANNANELGNPPLAESMLNEAEAMPDRPRNDPELEARLRAVKGWIASTKGDPAQALKLFRESHQLAVAALGPDDPRTLDSVAGQVLAERQLGNFDNALALNSELTAAASRAKGASSKRVTQLEVDRLDILQQAGRYFEAISDARAAEPRCISVLGPKDDLCGRLLIGRVQAEFRLGGGALSAADDARMDELIDNQASPALAFDALQWKFSYEVAKGPSPRLQSLFERMRAFGESSGEEVKFNALIKAKALLALADARLRVGDGAAARLWIDKALSLVPDGDRSPGALMIRGVGQVLGGVAALREGRSQAAIAAMRLGLDDVSAVRGREHPLTQLFALNLAAALHAAGRTGEALRVHAQAEVVLRRALGESSATFGRVQRLASRLLVAPVAGPNPGFDYFS